MLDVSEGLAGSGDPVLKSALQAVAREKRESLEPTFRKYLDPFFVNGDMNLIDLVEYSGPEALQRLADYLLKGVVHEATELIATRISNTIENKSARTEGDVPHDFAGGEGQPWFYPGPNHEEPKSASAHVKSGEKTAKVEQIEYIDPAAAAHPPYFHYIQSIGFAGPAEGDVDHDDFTGVPPLQAGKDLRKLRDEHGDLIHFRTEVDEETAPVSGKILIGEDEKRVA